MRCQSKDDSSVGTPHRCKFTQGHLGTHQCSICSATWGKRGKAKIVDSDALEEAAKVAETLYPDCKHPYYTFEIDHVRADCAAAIRALAKEGK